MCVCVCVCVCFYNICVYYILLLFICACVYVCILCVCVYKCTCVYMCVTVYMCVYVCVYCRFSVVSIICAGMAMFTYMYPYVGCVCVQLHNPYLYSQNQSLVSHSQNHLPTLQNSK